jgi:membrane carboxypeptidase/penicillin-binding protein PbpC
MGYTPQLAVGVWAGNADGRPMVQVSGVEGAGPIWHDFMEDALRGQPESAFTEPPGLERVRVCALSGLLPTPYCPHMRTELFIEGTAPTQRDDWYRPIQIDAATGLPAEPGTPPERVIEEVFVLPPPEAQEWAREHSWPLPPDSVLDVTEAPSGRIESDAPLVITSPDSGTVYRLSQSVPESYQSISVRARTSGGVVLVEVTLYVDGEPLTTQTTPPYEAIWQLRPGEHVFLARGVDEDGQVLESENVTVQVLTP